MMFGAGLMMLLFLALPVVLVVALVAVVAAAAGGGWQRWLGSAPVPPQRGAGTPMAGRVCAHCGQPLEAGWAHCPYCGASAAGAGQ